jgi:hypothetical protein
MIVEKLTVERAKKFLEDNDYRVYYKDRVTVLHTSSILSDLEIQQLEESIPLEDYLRRTMVQDLAHHILNTPGIVWEVTTLRNHYSLKKKIDLSVAFIRPRE